MCPPHGIAFLCSLLAVAVSVGVTAAHVSVRHHQGECLPLRKTVVGQEASAVNQRISRWSSWTTVNTMLPALFRGSSLALGGSAIKQAAVLAAGSHCVGLCRSALADSAPLTSFVARFAGTGAISNPWPINAAGHALDSNQVCFCVGGCSTRGPCSALSASPLSLTGGIHIGAATMPPAHSKHAKAGAGTPAGECLHPLPVVHCMKCCTQQLNNCSPASSAFSAGLEPAEQRDSRPLHPGHA